jgi:UDP-GlcNAc:undecaprenyl-phosphate GlcNAc-1-phosphate transferase
VTNAINFSDGLDGLASYLSIVSVMSFAIIFAYQGRTTLALPFALTLAGAIAGFIPYNRNPALIFMGDTGSMFIGFMLSLLSIACIRLETTLYAMIVPVYLIFIPIIDMLMSILRRLITKKSIMKPDKMHFHHQLNKRFANHTLVVIILALSQVIFSAAGIFIFIYKQYILGSIILGCIIIGLSVYTLFKGLCQRRLESNDVQ